MNYKLKSYLNQVKLFDQFQHDLLHCAARATLTLSLANALEAVQRKRSQLQLSFNFTWGIYADLLAVLLLLLSPHLLLILLLLTFFRSLLSLSLCPFTSVLCVCQACLIKVSQPQPSPRRNYCHSCKKNKMKKRKPRSTASARSGRVVAKLFTIRNCRPFWYWINMLNAHATQLLHCTSCRHLDCLLHSTDPFVPRPFRSGDAIAQFSIVHKMLAKMLHKLFWQQFKRQIQRRLCKPDWMTGKEVSPRRRRRQRKPMANPEAAQWELPPSPPATPPASYPLANWSTQTIRRLHWHKFSGCLTVKAARSFTAVHTLQSISQTITLQIVKRPNGVYKVETLCVLVKLQINI